ncbi:MAG: hypothetical protein EOO87_13950 [Pedobacter sp.]|nr:MAG: hypothetical protein EOO87_13950 [Pedobacter sp.]
MLLLLPIILFVVLLVFSIKKAKQQVNVNKHVLIRLSVLAGFIALTFLIVYLVEGRSGTLGSFYISAYFLGAWLLYLIVEAISLFVIKVNVLARTNLVILSIVAFIVAMVVVQLA